MKFAKLFTILLAAAAANGCFKLDTDSTQQCIQTTTTCSGGATLSGCYQGNVVVPAGATCNFTGLVIMKSGATFTAGAGSILKATPGQSPASSIIIDVGATINAIGTAANPVTFTSGKDVGQRAQQDWGGLVIRGRSTHNFATEQFTTEFDDSAKVGSKNTGSETESSGTLNYVRVEFGGKQATSAKEYNAITFETVGSGTVVDYIHTHNTGDDGIEFFGGTVNVKHVLITNYGDDGFDWTYGWRGKAQYVIVNTAFADGTSETNGIEADNSDQPNGDNLTPKSSPTLANFTMTSNGNRFRNLMRLRRGTQAKMYNFYVGNWCNRIRVENTVGQGKVTTGNVTAGTLKIQGILLENQKNDTTVGNNTTCGGADITGVDNAGGLIFANDSAGGEVPATAATAADGMVTGATFAANYTASGLNSANWVQNPVTVAAWFPANTVTTNAVNPTTLDSFFGAGTYLGAMDNTTNWLTGGWVSFPAN